MIIDLTCWFAARRRQLPSYRGSLVASWMLLFFLKEKNRVCGYFCKVILVSANLRFRKRTIMKLKMRRSEGEVLERSSGPVTLGIANISKGHGIARH